MYAVDLHTHSRFFHAWHGRATWYDSVGLKLNTLGARLRRLDAFAVTNHDYTYSAEVGFPTIPGIEVSTANGHVVLVGPNPPSRTAVGELTPSETADLAHERGCAAILAHPYRNSAARDSGADFDAIEINGKNPEHIVQTQRLADRLDLPLVGGSDAHYLFEVGRAYTRVEADEMTPTAVADAIRDGRVTAVTKFGPLDRALDLAYTRLHTDKEWMETDEIETGDDVETVDD